MKKPERVMSDSAVRAKTGRDWKGWFAILDRAGGKKLDHKGIVAYLASRHPEAGPWWQQMITVCYERERGLRDKHQRPDGYSINRSKTIAVPLAKLFAAWNDVRARGQWLGTKAVTVRKATPNKSIRISWPDKKTSVEVNFYAKGTGKSQVTVEHSKLPTAHAAERMKSYWAETLERLNDYLAARTK